MTRDDLSGTRVDDAHWREIRQVVASEADPERLSKLVDKLLQELDARRAALREEERKSRLAQGDA